MGRTGPGPTGPGRADFGRDEPAPGGPAVASSLLQVRQAATAQATRPPLRCPRQGRSLRRPPSLVPSHRPPRSPGQPATTEAPSTTPDHRATPPTPTTDPPQPVGGNYPAPGASIAIAYAEAQLGKPYQWGGAGPNSFDCSGLVMMAWERGGRLLPPSRPGPVRHDRADTSRRSAPRRPCLLRNTRATCTTSASTSAAVR